MAVLVSGAPPEIIALKCKSWLLFADLRRSALCGI
jgi:hypothetical protein